MKRLALRALLTLVYGLAGLGTAAAYAHFVVGAVAGFDGIAQGRYFLGPVLSILCVLAAFALWRVWLIGGRLWRYGAYINPSPQDRSYDAAGLAAAGAAFVGFIAIAEPIYRADDITFFSILLAPAACVAIIAFFCSTLEPRTSPPDDLHEIADRAGSAVKLADLPGLAAATAIGLLGVYYLVPRPRSGWSVCDWTVFYPLHPNLWPVERLIEFDGCSSDVVTLSMISGVLSLICLVTGVFAAAIGREASAARGARAAAIVVACTLAKLALHVSDTPDAPYIGWVKSLIAGVLIVLGAAWLGYVGGRRAMRRSQRRRRRQAPGPNTASA
jgi:hypothetical protein